MRTCALVCGRRVAKRSQASSDKSRPDALCKLLLAFAALASRKFQPAARLRQLVCGHMRRGDHAVCSSLEHRVAQRPGDSRSVAQSKRSEVTSDDSCALSSSQLRDTRDA
jgi:C4-dicarboxylate-specific signal transduction histidine kinase